MAAPEHVPIAKDDQPRTYASPPWRSEGWYPQRPADLEGAQPRGPRFGNQGPDQGYALKLARRFRSELVLEPDESEDDAIAGCVDIANKRASLFGRAPMIHDLTMAFTLWGFLGDADPELVRLRKAYFAGVASPHSYTERRRVADVVPAATLRLSPSELARAAEADPRREKLFKRRDPAAAAVSPA